MENFNPQIDHTGLPKAEDVVFQKLEQDYLSVMLWAAFVRSIILILVLCISYYVLPFYVPQFIILMVAIWCPLFIIWTFVKTIQGFKRKAYALRGKDIIYKSGWLWKTVTTTPFNRVQHITIEQGPIERQFGLSRLKVFTAGGSASDLTIPGIRKESATELKEYIVKNTHLDEEE